MNRVGGGDDSADDRQVPENQRNVALPLPLGSDPLDDESRAENELAEEAEGQPGAVESQAHSSSFTLYLSMRLDIQRTARQSTRPRTARFIAPYLETPSLRGRE